MKIALAIYASAEIKTETRFLSVFSNDMEEYFLKKQYGDDLIEIIIGIICVSSIFDSFFSPKKPKYIKNKKNTKSSYTHQTYEVEKCLTFDIKLDFENFKKFSEIEAKRHLSLEIIKSLEILETMKYKIKDFDIETFKNDIISYFKIREFV
jgi:hypothetical protein